MVLGKLHRVRALLGGAKAVLPGVQGEVRRKACRIPHRSFQHPSVPAVFLGGAWTGYYSNGCRRTPAEEPGCHCRRFLPHCSSLAVFFRPHTHLPPLSSDSKERHRKSGPCALSLTLLRLSNASATESAQPASCRSYAFIFAWVLICSHICVLYCGLFPGE